MSDFSCLNNAYDFIPSFYQLLIFWGDIIAEYFGAEQRQLFYLVIDLN